MSQSRLKAVWPRAMDLGRQRGNHVLNAHDLANRHYYSDEERKHCHLAIDWLRSRLLSWPTPTSHGLLQTSIFDDRAENLRNSYLNKNMDPLLFQMDLDNFLDFFISLTKLFDPGHGIGRAVYNEVIDMGLRAAPLVATDPEAMHELTYYMWTMTGYDSKIIVRMVNAISPLEQRDLEEVAKDYIIEGEQTRFSVKVIASLSSIPENMIEYLVLNNYY